MVKTYPLPVEGGCPKGRGVVEDERAKPTSGAPRHLLPEEGECARNRAAISSQPLLFYLTVIALVPKRVLNRSGVSS